MEELLFDVLWVVVAALVVVVLWRLRKSARQWMPVLTEVFWWAWCWTPMVVFGLAIVWVLVLVLKTGSSDSMDMSVWWLVIAVAVLISALGHRARGHELLTETQRLLAQIEIGIRLHAPLVTWLTLAARDERMPVARLMEQVVDRLECGESLSQALATNRQGVPERNFELLASAERFGRLPATLRVLMNQQRQEQRDQSLQHGPSAGWVALVAVGMFFPVLVFSSFIAPKFSRIFEDFGLVTRLYRLPLTGSEGLSVMWLINVIAPLILLSLLGVWRWQPKGSRRVNSREDVVSIASDRVAWHLPLQGALERDAGLADACLLLAQATDAGADLAPAAREASFLPINYVLARRLEDWSDAQTQGLPPAAAARVARLPRYFQQVLQLTQHSGAWPQTFDFLAEHYRQRGQTRLFLLRRVLLYVAYGLTIFTVAVFAWACFTPLVELIWRCVESSGCY